MRDGQVSIHFFLLIFCTIHIYGIFTWCSVLNMLFLLFLEIWYFFFCSHTLYTSFSSNSTVCVYADTIPTIILYLELIIFKGPFHTTSLIAYDFQCRSFGSISVPFFENVSCILPFSISYVPPTLFECSAQGYNLILSILVLNIGNFYYLYI